MHDNTLDLRSILFPIRLRNSSRLEAPLISHGQNFVFLALQYRFSKYILFFAISCRIPTSNGYILAGRPFFIGVPVAKRTPLQDMLWHSAKVAWVLALFKVCIACASSQMSTNDLYPERSSSDTDGILAHEANRTLLESPTNEASFFQFSKSVHGAITIAMQLGIVLQNDFAQIRPISVFPRPYEDK